MPKGVILIAHGSQKKTWERELHLLLEQAKFPLPQKIVPWGKGYVATYLLGEDFSTDLDKLVDSLKTRGCSQIQLLPLFVSRVSTHVADLASYCAPYPETSLGPALDDHPLIIKLLTEEYEGLIKQKKPEATGMVLVGHGVREQGYQSAWTNWAAELAEKIFLNLAFRPELQRVTVASIYPDTVRTTVENLVAEKWLPVVLPLFLSSGLFTQRIIPEKLRGLPCLIGAPYLPNPVIAQWVLEKTTDFLD